ncbi:MAG TPA: hypothetical protein VMW03_01865 [Candidatus Krumholzibacteriaceae bacterium]|nr:hypothetical protein [Candidatus Krumholzibacteriaceae bacterium]
MNAWILCIVNGVFGFSLGYLISPKESAFENKRIKIISNIFTKNVRKWMYLGLGVILTCLVLIDFTYSETNLVQRYVPNIITEIIGIIIVVAFVDQLLITERKRENERLQEHERIKTAGLNIRSIPDDNVVQLKTEFEKLWEIGGLGDREYREAAMNELNQISIFGFDDKNKVIFLVEAIQKQFLELVGPEYVSFDEKWKEDLILKGLEIIEFTCCLTQYIFRKSFFNKVRETIEYFFEVGIDYNKEKIALKCFKIIENIEMCLKESMEESTTPKEKWEEGFSFITRQFSDMKEAMHEKIKQKD